MFTSVTVSILMGDCLKTLNMEYMVFWNVIRGWLKTRYSADESRITKITWRLVEFDTVMSENLNIGWVGY